MKECHSKTESKKAKDCEREKERGRKKERKKKRKKLKELRDGLGKLNEDDGIILIPKHEINKYT